MVGLSLAEMEEMTWGELIFVIEARQEGMRRRAQERSLIAYRQAGLIAQAVAEGHLPEIYDVFPFWSEEEIRGIKVERYRAVMERHAGRRIGVSG